MTHAAPDNTGPSIMCKTNLGPESYNKGWVIQQETGHTVRDIGYADGIWFIS